MNNNLIIEEILRGGDATLRALYPRYQTVFMKHIRASWKNIFDENTLLEAYLEAIANFYIRVKTRKLTELKHSVESYLIATGRNLLIHEAKRLQKNIPLDSLLADPIDDEQILFDDEVVEIKNKPRKQMLDAFAQLGKKCQQLLTLSLWEKKDTAEIMDIMDYANRDTLYSSKARCIQKLRDSLKK